MQVHIQQYGPAYLDEEYEFEVEVTNRDAKVLDVIIDVLLQPSEIDYAGEIPDSTSAPRNSSIP